MEPLPLVLRNAVAVEFFDVVDPLEEEGWAPTEDISSIPLPVEARAELETDHVGAVVYERGPVQHLFVVMLDPPHRGVHVRIDDWSGRGFVMDRRTLEMIEQTPLGANPRLALANLSRQQIAQALEALCRTPRERAVSALCYHAADHPEDLFAVTAAVRAGAEMQGLLIEQLREPAEAAVEVAVHLLGEVGDELAYDAIDALHLWDRGVFAEAMKKIRARRARPQERREDALAALAAKLEPWAWPAPARAPEPQWDLWDLGALLVVHEPRESAWWHLWGDDLPPNARPFAQLSLDDGVARIRRGGQTLFEVRLDRDARVETLRVPTPAPLGGVLLRVVREDGYRALEVAEIGVLAARDATWEALAAEDRRDVLYLAPSDSPQALAAMQGLLGE